jgi:hypothetical protein
MGVSPFLLDRRNFLVLGTAGALNLCLGDLAAAAEAIVVPEPEPMSIGFLEDSDLLPRLGKRMWRGALTGRVGSAEKSGEPRPPRILPARDLPLGDQNLAGGTVLLRIHGLFPRLMQQVWVEAVDLDVLYPSPEPQFIPGPLPFYAWSFRRRPGLNPSPPIAFTAPLGVDGQLDLALTVTARERAGMVKRRYAASFTVDWQEDRPKLHRGIYLLGLAPVWDSARTLPTVGEKARMDLLSIAMTVEPVFPE